MLKYRKKVVKKACNLHEHAKIKKIPIETLKKMESPLNLICVTPVKMDVLFSDFKKNGYSSRQILE